MPSPSLRHGMMMERDIRMLAGSSCGRPWRSVGSRLESALPVTRHAQEPSSDRGCARCPAHPILKRFGKRKLPARHGGTLPGSGGVLVGLGKRGVNMDRPEDLVEPDSVPHRQYEFDDEVARMRTGDGRAEYPIPRSEER